MRVSASPLPLAICGCTLALTTASLVASCGDDDAVPLPRPTIPVVSPDASDAAPDEAAQDAGDQDADASDDASPIISTDPNSAFEGETQVAVAPDGTICAAWIASSALPHVAYRLSMDGGTSWTPIRVVPLRRGAFTGDPSVSVDDAGNFYIGWLDVELMGTGIGNSHVFVGRVPAGTDEIATWSEASDPASANQFRDHSKLAVTASGTVVIAYLEAPSFDDPFGPGVASYSNDEGQTWQHAVVHDVAPDEFVNLFYLCAPDDGGARLFATYFYGSSTTVNIAVRYSDDDAATWSDPVFLNSGPIFAGGVDPTCVARGSDVWVGYGVSNLQPVGRSGSQAQQGLRLAHSTDLGLTFPDVIDATDHSVGKRFLFPTVALEDDGSVSLVFYAGQDEGDRMAGFFRRRFHAGSFDASEVVAAPLTFELERTTPNWLGDYVGFVSRGGALHATYTDNSSGTSHVGYQRLTQ